MNSWALDLAARCETQPLQDGSLYSSVGFVVRVICLLTHIISTTMCICTSHLKVVKVQILPSKISLPDEAATLHREWGNP